MKPFGCLLTFAVLSCMLFSCAKSDIERKDRIQIIGKWKLTESLIDIGNGNGKWIKETESNGAYTYFIFKNDGTVESNTSVDTWRYSIIDSTKIRFTYSDNREITYGYSVTSSQLFLNPPCYEACGFRFIRVD